MPMLDAETLETFRSMQSEDDPHFLKNFLDAYLMPLGEHMANLQAALRENNGKKFAHAAHAIKSGSTNLGIKPVVELCARMQRLGDEGQLGGGAADLCTELAQYIDAVRREIQALPEFGSKS